MDGKRLMMLLKENDVNYHHHQDQDPMAACIHQDLMAVAIQEKN